MFTCSTPFGIIGIHTVWQGYLMLVPDGCSTPFGIIGIHTTAISTLDSKVQTCSTPFGIIGIHTRANTASCFASFSAQRLSASSEFTPSDKFQVAGLFVCSTPFGIIGIHTALKADQPTRRLMCSTPFGIIGIHTAL